MCIPYFYKTKDGSLLNLNDFHKIHPVQITHPQSPLTEQHRGKWALKAYGTGISAIIGIFDDKRGAEKIRDKIYKKAMKTYGACPQIKLSGF